MLLPVGKCKHWKTAVSMWNQDEEITGSDRFKACMPYVLPLLDGEDFGKYIYESVPPLGFLDSLFIGPLHDFIPKYLSTLMASQT